MDITALKTQIKNKELDKFYIFTGPEIAVQRLYIREIAKVLDLSIKAFDSISNLIKNRYSTALVKSSILATIYNDKEYLSNEQLQRVITQNNTFSHDIIIFIYDTIDKRSKLYKCYQDHIVEFDYLRADVLERYIAKDINLDKKHCKQLVEICEKDYSRILLEIDKIKTFGSVTFTEVGNESNYDYNKAMDCLIEDGTIYDPPYDAIFDFVDAVLKRKPKLAFNLLEQSYAVGEATLVLISNLYNSTKQLLQVQSYKGDNLVNATGLTSFQIKLAKDRIGNYRIAELIELMRVIRKTEMGIKRGEIEDEFAIPFILTQTF